MKWLLDYFLALHILLTAKQTILLELVSVKLKRRKPEIK